MLYLMRCLHGAWAVFAGRVPQSRAGRLARKWKQVHLAKLAVGQTCALGHWPIENPKHPLALW